jgi:RNA polymerase sigma factor (sigma-70 family)
MDKLGNSHIFLGGRDNRTEMDTPELIFAAQASDLQSFNRLILGYQDAIHSLIYYLCPGQDAEAIMQAAVLQIYQRLPGFYAGDFRLWLFKIVVKVCRQNQPPFWSKIIWSRNGRKTQLPISRIPSRSSRNNSVSIESTNIQSCLLNLEPELRVVVVLIDMEKLDYSQAATVLGIPLYWVSKRLSKARWQLANHLETGQKDSSQEPTI